MQPNGVPPLCVFCDNPPSQFWSEDPFFDKFMGQVGLQLNEKEVVSLCEECYPVVAKAVDWGQQMGEVEIDVRSLQRIILKMMRQLTTLQSNYLGEMGKLEGKIKESQSINKQQNTKAVRLGVLKVVSEMQLHQKEISTRFPTSGPTSAFSNPIIPPEHDPPPNLAPKMDPLLPETMDIEQITVPENFVKLEPDETFILPDNPPPTSFSAPTPAPKKPKKFRPCSCQYCGKTYSRRIDLQAHISSTHTGDRPYKCHLCPQSFTRMRGLLHHKLSHTGVKPFQCSQCSRGFMGKQALQEHQLTTHTGQKPYSCPVCGLRFAIQRRIKEHMKKRHKSMGTEEAN